MKLFKNQLITLFVFLFLVLALPLSLFLVSQRQEIRKEKEGRPTTTVCPTAGPGCDYVGGDGIQQAVDAAEAGSSTSKTKILIKAGNYTRANYTEYINRYGKKGKCFVNTRKKFLIFEGEGEVILDGEHSANMSGFCSKGGEIEVKNLKIVGFKKDPDDCFANNTTQACSWGSGIVLELKAKATIQNNQISGNHGNGLDLTSHSQAAIKNNQINENQKDGITLRSFSQATIQNNQISGNLKEGVILFDSSQATIQNNQISGNQGDGIFLADSSQAKIINNSLYKNKIAGIDIYQCGDDNPSVEARNNIITHTEKNTDGTFGFGIGGSCLHDSGKLDNDTFAYNLIWGNEGDNTRCGTNELCEDFTGRINADPKFVNPEGGDFHLQAGSPAIDSGDPDIKDPDGSRSDMGVYGGPGACGSDPNLPGCTSTPTSTPTPTPPTATATPTSTPTPTLTPTPTPNPPGQVKAKFKVKFSGVDNKKPDQIVKVKIGRGETVIQELEQVSLTANNQGIYESQMINLSSTITPGANYYLLIKGPKHLRVKFCQNTGQTRPCTTGKITLNSGENTLDFTGYPLPGGDLPPQDGVVNSLDAVALTNCLFQTSSTCLQKADLNFDEIVNTMDINIMNNTIYTRWEDE